MRTGALFFSSPRLALRARVCALREILRSPRLAHKAPVMPANEEMVRSDCFKVLRINADVS